jgi:hypothetical protein
MDALLKDPRTRQAALEMREKYFGGGEMGMEALGAAFGAGNKWDERVSLETPLRHLYMTRGVPYEEVAKMVDAFNKLLC